MEGKNQMNLLSKHIEVVGHNLEKIKVSNKYSLSISYRNKLVTKIESVIDFYQYLQVV